MGSENVQRVPLTGRLQAPRVGSRVTHDKRRAFHERRKYMEIKERASVTPQISLGAWVQALDDAGLLRRYTDEKRVDELPQLMEDNPDKAILVERVKDCAFPFFANGMQSREICALALGCDPREVSVEVGRRSAVRYPGQLVDTAPCKDVVVKGDDVDLTIFPLFLHHTFDGQAYINDRRIVTKDPQTGDTHA